jgi:hypothetical protein
MMHNSPGNFQNRNVHAFLKSGMFQYLETLSISDDHFRIREHKLAKTNCIDIILKGSPQISPKRMNMIQNGCYGSHIGFCFRRLSWRMPGSTGPIFCGLLGVTEGRFLSMTSTATHSRWPPKQPSWIWCPSTGPIFCGLLGVTEGRFLSMISAATHSRWPPQQPSLIWCPSTGQFFVAYWSDWRKVSMTSATAHPRWPIWQPSWISFLPINLRMHVPIHLQFLSWVWLD